MSTKSYKLISQGFAVALAMALSLSLTACGGGDDGGGTPTPNDGADAAPAGAPDAAPTPPAADAAPAAPDAATVACQDLPQVECAACVAVDYPVGAAQLAELSVENCYCANECASACEAECADPTMIGSTCETCVGGLQPTSRCTLGLFSDCRALPECLELTTAVVNTCR